MKHLTLALTALFLWSCAPAAEKTDEGALADGLTVFAASETGISLAYKKGDLVLKMDALRGGRTPDMYQQDPDAPKWEVDAKMMSGEGRIFYTARGGDNWVDPTWATELELQPELFGDRLPNEAFYLLAAEAAKVLEVQVAAQVGPELAAKVAPLLRPLRDFGASAPMVYFQQILRLHEHLVDLGLMNPDDDPVITGPNGEVLFGSGGTTCDAWVTYSSNYYYIAVHDKSTAVIARHSATRLFQWLGYWAWVHDNCNHGTCAYDMGQKCFLQYYEAVEDYKPTWELQSCGTEYDAFSNDGHNCHDDTRVQMANFVYGNGHNQGPGSRFWCNLDDDSDISAWPGDQGGSPACSGSTSDGYNHPHMCRYQNTHGYNSAGYCYCDSACLTYNDCCIDGPW